MKVENLKTTKAILKGQLPYIPVINITRVDQELIKRVKEKEICIENSKDVTQILKFKGEQLIIEERSKYSDQDIDSEIKAEIKLYENDIIIKKDRGYTKIKISAYDLDKELKKAVDTINGRTIGKLESNRKAKEIL